MMVRPRSNRIARTRASWLVCVLVGLCAVCPSAAAQQTRNVAGAAEAFNKAQQAELRGDFQEAASLYALADEMAQANEALRGAARTAQKAGMNATAATHAAALLERSADDATSRALAEEILHANEHDLARLHVSCSVPCRVLIDGRITASRLGETHVLFARGGTRDVSASFESGNAPAQTMSLVAGNTTRATFDAPSIAPQVAADGSTAPAPSEPERRKISPWYLGTAATLTLVAGGLTIWSGLDVKSAHESYDRRAASATQDYEDGRKLEKRTNALIGVTAGLAVTTATLAFFTNFGRSKSQEDHGQAAQRGAVSLGPTRGGALLGWTRAF